MSKVKLDWALFEKAAAAVKQAQDRPAPRTRPKQEGLGTGDLTPLEISQFRGKQEAYAARKPLTAWERAVAEARKTNRSTSNFQDFADPFRDSSWMDGMATPVRPPPGWQEPQALDRLHFRRPSPPPGWQDPQDTGFTPSSPLPPPGWGTQPSTAPPVRPRPPVLDPSGWGDSGRSQMFNPQKPLPSGYPGSLNFGK